MAQRTTSLRQPSAIRGAGRGMHLLEMITAVAILAALLAVGARVTGRLPSERAAPLTGRPTRLLQMGGIWVNTAINPQRERIFRVLDPATGAETGETLPFHLPENGPPPTFSGDGHILAYTDTSPSYRAARDLHHGCRDRRLAPIVGLRPADIRHAPERRRHKADALSVQHAQPSAVHPPHRGCRDRRNDQHRHALIIER